MIYWKGSIRDIPVRRRISSSLVVAPWVRHLLTVKLLIYDCGRILIRTKNLRMTCQTRLTYLLFTNDFRLFLDVNENDRNECSALSEECWISSTFLSEKKRLWAEPILLGGSIDIDVAWLAPWRDMSTVIRSFVFVAHPICGESFAFFVGWMQQLVQWRSWLNVVFCKLCR